VFHLPVPIEDVAVVARLAEVIAMGIAEGFILVENVRLLHVLDESASRLIFVVGDELIGVLGLENTTNNTGSKYMTYYTTDLLTQCSS
jgi:hypothetical protein